MPLSHPHTRAFVANGGVRTKQAITACLTAGPHVVGHFTVHFPHRQKFFTRDVGLEDVRDFTETLGSAIFFLRMRRALHASQRIVSDIYPEHVAKHLQQAGGGHRLTAPDSLGRADADDGRSSMSLPEGDSAGGGAAWSSGALANGGGSAGRFERRRSSLVSAASGDDRGARASTDPQTGHQPRKFTAQPPALADPLRCRSPPLSHVPSSDPCSRRRLRRRGPEPPLARGPPPVRDGHLRGPGAVHAYG